MPREGEIIDYPPPNVYVPKKMPEECKAAREEADPIGKPVKLQGGNGRVSDVWFKQDDQFH